MAETTHLGLPVLEAGQAQKHVTVNEALHLLDGVVQLAVIDRDLAAPPGAPGEGDRYIVAAGATGDWSGQDDAVAHGSLMRGGVSCCRRRGGSPSWRTRRRCSTGPARHGRG